MADIVQQVMDDGLRGALMVFLLVISYKLYKAKISNEIESNCCEGFKWRFVGQNSGGGDLPAELNNV